MYNALAPQGGFDVRNFGAPVQAAQRANVLSTVAENMPLATFSEMGVPAEVQYNALASHGGPTVAASEAVQNYVSSGNGDLASGIVETAVALKMDPLDLATIISYETAGTFDPVKRGPTTQWGQHRGLIQFGEPQARQYGVDWSDPLGSQLGPNGAIARYYRQNGWQPGMGILDAYSIVNAGGPGLYHRSDANNGGAPGTVRDKVEQQMGAHRRNAERLLSGLRAPASTSFTNDALSRAGL